VDVLQRQYDTSITVKVHSLRIEDKLQGHVSPSCRYIVRSSISGDAEVDDMKFNLAEKLSPGVLEEQEEDEEDEEVFDDALAEFGVPGSPSSSEHGSFHRFFSSGSSDLTRSQEKSLRQWEPDVMNLAKEGTLPDIWVDAADEEVSDFANMRLIIRQIDSPDYDDTDIQVPSPCNLSLWLYFRKTSTNRSHLRNRCVLKDGEVHVEVQIWVIHCQDLGVLASNSFVISCCASISICDTSVVFFSLY